MLALLATETGLTKTEILSTVQGYRQRYRTGGDNASLERQFERDKDDIRELGVPLETVELARRSAGNNQTLRYRIPKGAYDLPADVAFSPEEIALLDLAAMVWREGSLSGESRRALMKLRSLGVESDEPLLGYAPRLRAARRRVRAAAHGARAPPVVRFSYLKPGEDAARRSATVAPLALVQYQGRWHLSTASTSARGQPAHVPAQPHRRRGRGDDDRLRAARRRPRRARPSSGCRETAREPRRGRRCDAGHGCRRRASARAAPCPARREPAQPALLRPATCFADELAGFGPEVLVHRAARPGRAVRERLEAVAAAHGGERMADAQPQRAQDKLAFLLALVPYLIDHDGVTVAEAAEHFDVPREQIREAVRADRRLRRARRQTGTYQHGDLFDIDWDGFEERRRDRDHQPGRDRRLARASPPARRRRSSPGCSTCRRCPRTRTAPRSPR